jgi:hypothetical protein
MEALAKCRKEVSKYFPSISQIAHIAAILTNGNPTSSKSPFDIAVEAIELWNACENMRSAKICELAQYKLESQKEFARSVTQRLFSVNQIEIPLPKKYPVDFDEFLRLTVGGRHKAHRLKIYRDYAKDMVWLGHVWNLKYKNNTAVMTDSEAEKLAAPASLDEVENYIKGTRDLIEHEGLYFGRARAFLEWRAKQPAERARKAANKRWNKPE